MSPSGHPPLQLANRPTLDLKNRMWIRSGDGYAADSLRYRVAKVHRDAEWSPLEKHLSPAKERSLLTVRMREQRPPSSCRRRREVATGSATPSSPLRPPPWAPPACSLCASGVRCCRRHRICWRREVRIMRHFLARSLATSRSASATPPTRDTAPVASLLSELAQIVPNKAFAWHS